MPGAPPLGSTILWFRSPRSAEVAEPCSSPMILPPTSVLAAQPGPDSPSHHDGALSAHSQLQGCSLSSKPGYTPPRSTPVSPSWPASLGSTPSHPSLCSPGPPGIAAFSSENTIAPRIGHVPGSGSAGSFCLLHRQQDSQGWITLNPLDARHHRALTMCCRLGFQTNGTGFLPSLGQLSSNLETVGLVRKWFP